MNEEHIDDVVHVGLSCTKNYLVHIVEVLNSLIELCSSHKFVAHVVVDCKDDEVEQLQQMMNMFGEHANVVVYSSSCFEDLIDSDKVRMDLSKMTYARLFMDKFLSNDIKRILWLEADLLFANSKVASMFNMPFGDNYAIGVVDYSMMAFGREERHKTQVSQYLNGGIISFNVEKMRLHGVFNQFNEFMSDLPKWFIEHNFADQTVMNYIMRGKVKFIDSTYNIQSIMFGYPQYDDAARECGYDDQIDMMKRCIVSHMMGAKPWEERWDTWQKWQVPFKMWQKSLYTQNRSLCISKFGEKYLSLEKVS